MQAIGTVLKEERKKQNKSSRLLAYEYGLQTSLISRIENAQNDIKVTSLWAICEALNIPQDVFIKKIIKNLPENFTLTD